MLFCAMFVACDNQENQSLYKAEDYSTVNFEAFFSPVSRATETTFENGDAISVFAVRPTSSEVTLAPSGNYANNLIYIYNGHTFDGGTKSIAISESDPIELAYFAIYPFQSGASDKFLFSVKSDQSKYADYTASDLCTAYSEPTKEDCVSLEFNHRMSSIEVKLSGENIATRSVSVKLNSLYTECNVDINADTYTATGTKNDIILGEHSSNTYQAIIVPQTVAASQKFLTLTLDGKEIPLNLAADFEFKCGKKTCIELEIKDNNVISINGYINTPNTTVGEGCEVTITNLVSMTDGIAFDFNIGEEVSYYYYGYIEYSMGSYMADEEIVEYAKSILEANSPEDNQLGYIMNLTPNTKYYLVAFGCNSDGSHGDVYKTIVKTKDVVSDRPSVSIHDVVYNSTTWEWSTTIASNVKEYYMVATSGTYADAFAELPSAVLAWLLKSAIDEGSNTPLRESTSWYMERTSTDNSVFIYTWAVGNDGEFAGELDTFYGVLDEGPAFSPKAAKKALKSGAVSKNSLRECLKNFVIIKK